jgi:CDP-diacylglycerol---glycerol-3-phosphate 3-phosphatidyltransferase
VNVPNAITVGRVLLVPVFLALAYRGSDTASALALGVFVIASASDSLDGYLARRANLESRMGAFLDPLADKLLVFSALFVLVDLRAFPLWAALLIVMREIGVQLLRSMIVNAGGTLPASRRAKEKTVLQIAMVCWWLIPWEGINLMHTVLLAGALVWTLWTGAEYFVAQRKIKEVVH